MNEKLAANNHHNHTKRTFSSNLFRTFVSLDLLEQELNWVLNQPPQLIQHPMIWTSLNYSLPQILTNKPTRSLSLLNAHISVQKPQMGYPVHVDEYDVMIVLLHGSATILPQNQIIGEMDMVYFPAGSPHGLLNHNLNVTTSSIVFEFHR